MAPRQRRILIAVPLFFLFTAAIDTLAGNLDPAEAPAPSMHTLTEIYDRVDALAASEPIIAESSVFSVSTGINMTADGAHQGEIGGSCTIPGRENSNMVVNIEHQVTIPTDTATGLPTGQRIHGPFMVTIYRDKASPKLYQAVCSGEQLRRVDLDFYRDAEAGGEELYYRVKLENAILIKVESVYPDLEKLSFTYDKITWTWLPDNVEAVDSWREPAS